MKLRSGAEVKHVYGGVVQAAMDYRGLGWYCTRIALREGRSRTLWKGAKRVESSVWLAKQPLRSMWEESGRHGEWVGRRVVVKVRMGRCLPLLVRVFEELSVDGGGGM